MGSRKAIGSYGLAPEKGLVFRERLPRLVLRVYSRDHLRRLARAVTHDGEPSNDFRKLLGASRKLLELI